MWQIFIENWLSYAHYLMGELSFQNKPWWHNYFLWLCLVSLFFFALEWIRPWRENQPKFRQDFWLDFFYMFFNFFIFSLIIYNAASAVVVQYVNDLIQAIWGIKLNQQSVLSVLPYWGVLIAGFIIRDFIQWWVHRLLHRVSWLWEFHKVHHSIGQMGFAGHLRYHWMENVVYRTLEYLPLALLGFGLYDFFVIHIFALAIGHYNHSNITVDGRITASVVSTLLGLLIVYSYPLWPWYLHLVLLVALLLFGIYILGPKMKIIFNSPEMHIWHHAHDMPSSHPYGINFGLSLAIWDYIFGTAVIPHNGRDIRLGFPGVDKFPTRFWKQLKLKF